MLVAFRYKLQLLDDTEFNVYVTPEYGFYGFLVATSASLIIGHLMVFFHRRSELQGLDPSNDIDCIFNHAFLMRDGSVRKLSVKFRCLIATMGVSVGSLLATGITMKTFGFEFGGLAGSMLGDQHQKQYSLLSIGAAIPSSVEDSPGAGIYALQAVYYFYAVVTPFVALLTMSCLLIYPLSRKIQLCLLTIAEIANSWSAVEVFGLSIVAAMLEISTFADFIIGSRCDLLNALLTEYGEGDIVTCYSVKSTISWHAVYLLIGSLLYSVWIYVVLQLLHTAMYERMHNDGNPQDDHWTIAQTMASSSFARMIFVTREDDLDEGVPTLSSNSTGPPIVSEELLVSPWQQENFTKEWKDAAERDPTWKEWKEATSVT